MSFKDFDSLKKSAQGQNNTKTIALAAAEDIHALEALKDLQKQINVRYSLVGNRQKIIEICQQIEFKMDETSIIDAVDESESAAKAVALVAEGKADVLMKGKLHTSILLKAVLNKETGIQQGRLLRRLSRTFSPL